MKYAAVAVLLLVMSHEIDGELTRLAFLEMIQRPTVAADPVTRLLPDSEGLLREHVSFASEEGDRVAILLVKSSQAGSRRPVVIILHGTNGTKEGQADRLQALANSGFIAVGMDARYHGERMREVEGPSSPYVNAILNAYRTGAEHPFLYDTVWDVMRLVDYLETRNDVDASRIGLMGISKGGMETYLAAAVDPRIAAAVPIIGVQSFGWALDHNAWDSRIWTLRGAVEAASRDAGEQVGAQFVRKFYDRVAPSLYTRFDGPAMLPLIAPRPLLVINGDSDPRTPIAGVRACAAEAEKAYGSHGVPERFVLHLQPNAGHEVTQEADRAALAWFERWLHP